jgi:hypothetical protein
MKTPAVNLPLVPKFSILGNLARTALVALLLPMGISEAQDAPSFNLETLSRLPAEAISGSFRAVKAEDLVAGSSRVWLAYYPPFMEMALYQDPANSHWMHLIPYKKKGKDEQVTHFALMDINEGTVKELGSIPGWEQIVCIWVNQKLYLGMNNVLAPGRLVEFDPSTQSLNDLGSPFLKSQQLRCIAVGPDGTLVLGGDPPEVALYDPVKKAYSYYGVVGSKETTKAYYVSLDEDYIYVVARGTDPWHLIAIHRKTRETKNLLQVPVNGLLALGRMGTIWTTDDSNNEALPKKNYYVKHGNVFPVSTPAEADKMNEDLIGRINSITRPVRTETAPKCFMDESPTYLGKGEMKFIYQKSGEPAESTNVWKEVAFPIPMGPPHALNRLAALADGRLAFSGEKYAPLVVWNPKTRKTAQMPCATEAYHNSVYSMTAVGNTVFVGGYALAIVMAFNPDKPITQAADIPGRKKVPFNSPEANPRLVGNFSEIAKGAHMAVAMEVGADGMVYLCARRHRYFFGFDICWFDPKDFSRRGVLEVGKALDHYQMSWMSLSADKEELVVSTYVEGNPQINSPHPADAKLFFFDLKGKKLGRSVVPLPGVKSLSGIAAVDASTLVGGCYLEEEKATVFYRFNLKTNRVEAARKYQGLIHGKPGTTDLPTKGYDFALGPDGKVWTLGRMVENGPQVILKIDPQDLRIQPVCPVGGFNIRFLFRGKDLILTGQESLQRIKNIVD